MSKALERVLAGSLLSLSVLGSCVLDWETDSIEESLEAPDPHIECLGGSFEFKPLPNLDQHVNLPVKVWCFSLLTRRGLMWAPPASPCTGKIAVETQDSESRRISRSLQASVKLHTASFDLAPLHSAPVPMIECEEQWPVLSATSTANLSVWTIRGEDF